MVFRLEAFFAKGFVRLEAIFHHGIFIASTDAWRGSGSATQWAEVAGLLAIASALVALVLRRRRKNWRHCAAASLALATVCAGAAGARAWLRAAVGPERLAVLDAMARRPSDPWPRGADHVPLGAVGATEMDKGYLETGGSFSPWFGSFGLSFWIVGDDGQLIATSDGTGGAQSYRAGPKGEPGVVSVTDAYEAKVTILADGRRTLDIESRLPRGRHLEVALRGVGPAGGALNEILVDGKMLTLNRRFSVGLDQAPDLAFVGEEGTKDWLSPMKDAPSRTLSATGWAHARFRLPASGRLSLTIADPQRRPPATALPLGPSPKLTGTDPRFAESLRAQIETLNQSLVGMQTRPGDPAAYPLEWQRDGAFVLVALARSGERDLARSLAPPFAQRDFFGGYGAEADAPGLALWALGEVSAAIGDPAFEHDIWPDIERKAGLILDMLQANDDVRRDFQGPLLPRLAAGDYDGKRVALPARDGLISGTMDFTQPVFYVNAVSHSGLAAAARMARRTGHDKQAEAWEREARALQAAWRRAFAQDTAGPGQVEDDHTFIFSLWPAELAPPEAYQRLLERRWADRRDAAGGFRAKPAGHLFRSRRGPSMAEAGTAGPGVVDAGMVLGSPVGPRALYAVGGRRRREHLRHVARRAGLGRSRPCHAALLVRRGNAAAATGDAG